MQHHNADKINQGKNAWKYFLLKCIFGGLKAISRALTEYSEMEFMLTGRFWKIFCRILTVVGGIICIKLEWFRNINIVDFENVLRSELHARKVLNKPVPACFSNYSDVGDHSSWIIHWSTSLSHFLDSDWLPLCKTVFLLVTSIDAIDLQ